MKWGNRLLVAFRYTAFALAAMAIMLGMGPGAKNGTSREPQYVELRKGEASMLAEVVDGDTVTKIEAISFSGHTDVGGILSEKDDARSKIDLEKDKEIEVITSDYESQKHPGTFVKARIHKQNAQGQEVVEESLIPHNVEFSGKTIDTGTEKAWRLRDVNKIKIIKQLPKKAAALRYNFTA